MAVPATRQQFKDYCLRRLGHPVIEINIDDDQVEDRVDEALKYYWDYHFDGTEKIYYKHPVTSTDITNKYITLADNIIGAVNIFDVGNSFGTSDMFSIRYQIALNDLYTLTTSSMIPYYMSMSHLQFLEQLLVGKQPLRYNRHTNKLYIDMDWNNVREGYYIVVEAYQIVDPTTSTDAWGDRWLASYATCLLKLQWGGHISKYVGAKTTGGIMINGDKIYNDALAERIKLEQEMIYSYSLPNSDMIG